MTRHAFARALALFSLAAGCGSSPPPQTQAAPATREGMTCSAETDCGPGLACCYPCGIEGCQNQCIRVEPGTGCPPFP